ncbi:MAG: hypothetical protein GX818_02930, partial [Tissierellia bacterium]|nr:hypothetical protein [Tissierellia bacterium]
VNTEVSSGTLDLIVNDASNMSEGDIIYLVNDSEWVSRTISSINSNTLTLNNTISVVAADSLVFVSANLLKTDLAQAATQIRNGITLTDDLDLNIGWKIGLYNTPVDTSVESTLTWFTVDNINNDLIILDSVIADDIVAEGSVLYYETNISRPNDIDSISYLEELSDSYENPVNKVARKTYLSYTDKKSLGSPIAAYFNRDKEESSIYLYNTPDKKYFVKFSFQETFDIFSTASDTADFPDEYVSCIIWNLALELGIIYKIPDLANIQVQADKLKNIAQSWDNEMVSFSISPEICD